MQITDGEDFSRRAREIETQILRALAKSGQSNVAKVLGLSESSVSRLKDGHFETMSRQLAALGLRVVPSEWRMADPETLRAFMTLFNVALNSHEHPHEILFIRSHGQFSDSCNPRGSQAAADESSQP
jgi:hypothetical protein